MASQFVYYTSDGGGRKGGDRARVLHRWIHAQDNAELIVYGGDVYDRGEDQEFAEFLEQIGGNPRLYCETPGNHDWKNRSHHSHPDARPVGYERFWRQFAPPLSRQPIDTAKVAGARYEHFIDVNGWRLIFVDTGALEYLPKWPMSQPSRVEWLRDALTARAGRGKIVFAHHSRLQWGRHEDEAGLQQMWESLFDDAGKARASFTLGGHNHNVSIYGFRGADLQPADAEHGVQIWVNGAGGIGDDDRAFGTPADLYPRSAGEVDDPAIYAVTQIVIHDDAHATARLLSFGGTPLSDTEPQELFTQDFHA